MSEQYSHLTGGPAAPQTPPPAPGWQPEPPRKRRRGLKITLAVLVVGTASLITLGVVGQNSSGSTSTADPRPAPSGYNTYQPPASNIPDSGTTEAPPAPSAPAAPAPTVAQEQALESAKSYLDMGGFSRAGLIDQLSSSAGEGFKMADARWAVNHTRELEPPGRAVRQVLPGHGRVQPGQPD
jgi:hypothetical protein